MLLPLRGCPVIAPRRHTGRYCYWLVGTVRDLRPLRKILVARPQGFTALILAHWPGPCL